MLRSENVRDHEVVGEAGEGFLRGGPAHNDRGSKPRTGKNTAHPFQGIHRGGCRVRVVVRRCFPEKALRRK